MLAEHQRESVKHQNQLADLRAFRVVEALQAFAGSKTSLSPEKVFPSLADVVHESAVDDEESLLESFESIRTVLGAASVRPPIKA